MLTLTAVRTNNLKGFSVAIDPAATTVVCGLSGSGKSSLVFDTIHAESQRRYLETLSPRVREQLGQFARPDCDRIEGLPPTIALPQEMPRPFPNATVGDETELTALLADIAAESATFFCPECGETLVGADAAALATRIADNEPGTRLLIAFPIDRPPREAWPLLRDARFVRAVVDGQMVRLDEQPPNGGGVYGVADRVVAGRTERTRLIESLQLALRAGQDRVALFTKRENRWEPSHFARGLACPNGHLHLESPTAEDLLGRTASAQCRRCEGTGCDDCDQTGLAAVFRIGTLLDRSWGEWLSQSIGSIATASFGSCDESERAIRLRTDSLTQLGLSTLTLDRPAESLSSSQLQRLKLAGLAASDLTNTLIVLDEPTSGLSADDVPNVLRTLRQLRDAGNGLLIVEHRREVVETADRVIEIGPAAGRDGGEIVFDGPPGRLAEAETATGLAFRESPSRTGQRPGSVMLAGDWPPIPLDALTIVRGPAASGKTRLLKELDDRFAKERDRDGEAVATAEIPIEDVFLIDRRPISKTRKSCVATLTKAFDEVRALYASLPESNRRGLVAKHYSFNAPGGSRCRQCRGQGSLDVAMAAMSDLRMTCPRCSGRRYEGDVLHVKYRRRSIADVLAMTVEEALAFFRTQIAVHRRLQPVKDVGLGYLTLGRSLPTLSGGESQRLRIATHLTTSTRGRVLFLFDEPTRGLHPLDARTLAASLRRLLEIGHTVVAVDHSDAMLAAADWLIELDGETPPRAGPPD